MSEPAWVPLGAAGIVPNGALVTSLPVSPVDGQEVILTDSLTAPTYTWRLRYVAAKASNRWVFVGGSSLAAVVAASEQTASTSYVNLVTTGPQITVPVAGLYEMDLGYDAAVGPSATISASPKIGAAVAADANATRYRANLGPATSVLRSSLLTLAAGDVLLVQYKTDGGGTGTFENRRIAVRPVAVGG